MRDRRDYPLHGRGGIFVFPDTDYPPTGLRQRLILLPISFGVRCKLLLPEPPVGPWQLPMLGAPMPEAAIDEYCDAFPAEDHVGTDGWAGSLDPHVHAESQAVTMQHRANLKLRLRVAPAICAHRGGRVRT